MHYHTHNTGEPPKAFYTKEWATLPKAVVSTMDPSFNDILAHLVGQIGASSVPVPGETPPATNPEYDVNASWKSIDEDDAFIAAEPRSTDRTVNANEKKDNYVFGKGGECVYA